MNLFVVRFQSEKLMSLMSLTCRGKHRGEDQQSRNPRLELHPKLVSPKLSFSSNWFQSPATNWDDWTKLVSSSLVFKCNRKWWGAAAPGDTFSTYMNLSPTHEQTLSTWKKKFSSSCLFIFFFFELQFLMFQQRINLRNLNLYPMLGEEGSLSLNPTWGSVSLQEVAR